MRECDRPTNPIVFVRVRGVGGKVSDLFHAFPISCLISAKLGLTDTHADRPTLWSIDRNCVLYLPRYVLWSIDRNDVLYLPRYVLWSIDRNDVY